MSEVFVSYARPDEARADEVAAGLRALGYQVWRDDELPAHRAYADVIEERLRNAKAVVAVTSRNTAFQFKGQSLDVSDVAKRLEVALDLFEQYFDRLHSTIPLIHMEADRDVDVVREHRRFREMVAAVRQRLGVESATPTAATEARPRS